MRICFNRGRKQWWYKNIVRTNTYFHTAANKQKIDTIIVSFDLSWSAVLAALDCIHNEVPYRVGTSHESQVVDEAQHAPEPLLHVHADTVVYIHRVHILKCTNGCALKQKRWTFGTKWHLTSKVKCSQSSELFEMWLELADNFVADIVSWMRHRIVGE